MTGPPDLEGATAPVLGPSRVRRLAVQGAAVFAVALVLYGALGAWVGTERLAGTFDRISPGALLPLVGLVLLGWGLRALRWHLYVRRL
jgi:hypothetical protein